MTRAILTKLLLLVLLAFIICLPEFFTLYRAPRGRKRGSGGKWEKGVCDLSQTREREKWEKVLTTMDSERATRDGDQEHDWFRCETDTNLTELHTNISLSALYVQVFLELQFRDGEALNLTLWGLRNHNSLQLHPPEEEDEDKGSETKAFYCCYPGSMSSGSVTQGLCLLWLFNQTALRAAAHSQPLLPKKDEWRCVFRVLWLVLLCVVLLIIFTSLFGQICLCKKPKIYPVGQNFTGQHLNGTPQHIEETLFWTEMPPIYEVPNQEEIETLLDGNNDQSFAANLHHRCHHITFPPTADRPCERQTFH